MRRKAFTTLLAAWSLIIVDGSSLVTSTRAQSVGPPPRTAQKYEKWLKAIDGGRLPKDDLPRVLLELAAAYRSEGRLEDALRIGKRHRDVVIRISNGRAAVLQEIGLQLAQDAIALGLYAEASDFLQEADRFRRHARSNAWIALSIVANRARILQLQGYGLQARDKWEQVESEATRLSDSNTLTPEQRTECALYVLEARQARNKSPQEILSARKSYAQQLQRLMKVHAQAGDVGRVTNCILTLSREYQELGLLDAANRLLTQAASIQPDSHEGRRRKAEVLVRRASLARADGRHDDDYRLTQQAVTLLEQTIDKEGGPRDDLPAVRDGLQRLCDLYQHLGEHQEALRVGLRLGEARRRTLGPEHVLTNDAVSTLGTLYGVLQQFDQAAPLLEKAVEYWRSRQQAEPRRLASALNDWSAVLRANGSLKHALNVAEEAVRLRREHLASDDLNLAYSYNNRASILAAMGRYAEAMEDYQQTLDVCGRAGASADALKSRTLYNVAVNYQSQGQLVKAAEYCRQSIDIERKLSGGAEDLAAANRHVALAEIYRVLHQWEQAARHGERALEICQQQGQGSHPAAAAAHRQLATLALRKNANRSEAAGHWNKALKIYRKTGRVDLEARMLNNLGVLAYAESSKDLALEHFEAAAAIYQSIHARPQDYYSVLCNLAMLRYDQGERRAARDLMLQAADLIETPRTQTTLAESQRADFFYQFADAFDRIVDWSLEEDDVRQAFMTAERSRSRSFLDQMQLAGIDLRDELRQSTSPKASELLQREEQIRTRMNSIVGEALRARRHADSEQRLRQLDKEWAQLRKQYAKASAEIRGMSKLYRNRRRDSSELASVEEIQKNALGPRDLLLVYYLGGERSHLFCISAEHGLEAFRLQMTPAAVRILENAQLSETVQAIGTRGLAGIVQSPKGSQREPEAAADGIGLGVNRATVRLLVDQYRAMLADPKGEANRALTGTTSSKKGRLIHSPLTGLGDLLLPEKVRKLIVDRKAEQLIVVPDGALHALPFEAMRVTAESGSTAPFAIDALPPMSYAPSANSLLCLREREDSTVDRTGDVLTVGNPAYDPDAEHGSKSLAARETETYLALGGRLSPLPNTQAECQRIVQTFGERRVTILTGPKATEGNASRAMAGKRYLHFAAHGFVDSTNDNLFGAIALTPPRDSEVTSDNDGFLSLRDIHSQPLLGCELVVLSACQTGYGPRRKLEGGSSLAHAFLAAGAKRAIASHWNVDDPSTAELIGLFFEAVARAERRSEPISYARALRDARLALRSRRPEWAAPYYWAPFVLHGPAE